MRNLSISFKFDGYSYLMLATSINERSAELATHTIFTLKASTTIYFKELEQFDKPQFEVLR
ncbi:hypothetical protein IDM30_21020 [Acinetobacter seifertii]|nr:hypothetical protein [Acinetobacter seifertii]